LCYVDTPNHHLTQHIKLLRAAVREALPDEVPDENGDVTTSRVTVDRGSRHVVCVSHIESPYNFYVNIVDNLSRLEFIFSGNLFVD
jgi:hypothetical protein